MNTQNMMMVRALKGAPISVVFALLISQTPLTKSELMLWTDYTDKTIKNAIDTLSLYQFLMPTPNGYTLTQIAKQISFENYLLQQQPQIEPITGSNDTENFRKAGESPTPVTTSSRSTKTTTTSTDDSITSPSPEILRMLIETGISKTRASAMAALDHVHLDYVQAHIQKFELERLLDSSHSCGLLISRIERCWSAPAAEDIERLEKQVAHANQPAYAKYLGYLEEE